MLLYIESLNIVLYGKITYFINFSKSGIIKERLAIIAILAACLEMTSNTRKNWELCALCGIDKPNEKLVCPFNSKRGDCGSGYSSLANILAKFSEIGEVPIQVSLSSLDEGKGVEETLKSHRASWHKSCFNRCSNEKLIRAQKRKHEECSDSDEVNQSTPLYSPVKTRASLGTSKSRLINDKTTCFFCGETGKICFIKQFQSYH